MTFSGFSLNHHRLGWLQLSILTFLWNREMYGLEIQKHLQLLGHEITESQYEKHKVSPAQLYPALKKLEEMKAIESRDEVKNNITRTYYKTTDIGKGLMKNFTSEFLENFFSVSGDKIDFVADDTLKLLEENLSGKVIVDFTNREVEEILVKIANPKNNIAKYYIKAHSAAHAALLKDRIDHYELGNVVSILEVVNDSIGLPSHSVDIAFSFFTLHEKHKMWILKEMARVLKPTGKGVIVDYISMGDHMFEQILSELVLDHSHFGMEPNKLKEHLKERGLHPTKEKYVKGILYLVVETEQNSR